MGLFLLQHRHAPEECGAAFMSFKGVASPLRHRMTLASCDYGDHAIWWTVEAEDEVASLALLPHFTAQRTTATRIREVQIP